MKLNILLRTIILLILKLNNILKLSNDIGTAPYKLAVNMNKCNNKIGENIYIFVYSRMCVDLSIEA